MTIEDVVASLCIEDCRAAEPGETVDVGSGINEDWESRVEVVKVE